MIASALQVRLEPVARRCRRLRLWRSLALCYGLAALVGLGLIGLHALTGWWSGALMRLVGIAAFVAAFLTWRRQQKQPVDWLGVVRQIEAKNPELNSLLLAAAEQQPQPDGKLNFLQERVIEQALAHSREHRWTNLVTSRRLALAQAAHLVALVGLVAVLFTIRSSEAKVAARRLFQAAGVTVTPGDASLEKGSSLIVFARFTGPLPPEVNLVLAGAANPSQPLVKSLDDPVFGGSVPEVQADFTYHLEYAGQRTREFRVAVFEHPKLERANVSLAFPAYTGLPEKRIEDTKRVTAVEGTTVELALQLNKPVKSAQLIAKDRSIVPLLVETNHAAATLKGFTLEASANYDLVLTDADGRTNKIPAHFVFEALKNRPPELKLASPRGDQHVSSLEEITLSGEAWDDFGLKAYGLGYTVAGRELQWITLGGESKAGERRQFTHLLALEELRVQPDELIAYFLWADDIGPDGQVRRTSSDMYFAEVRPFEEIYREAQSPSGGEQQGEQGQQGNQSAKLVELQKQIISATWKLQRQQAGLKAAAKPAEKTP